MFVCSVKSKKSKLIAVVLILLLLLLGFVVLSQLDIGSGTNSGTTAPENLRAADSVIVYDAADESERKAFIEQFGWEIQPEPAEISEVLIPAEFDEVYQRYNELQKSQGLDLEPFRGQRVKRWSYVITNYPGMENAELIRIDLLICKGTVVGGDVCSIAENGFMHGFSAESAAAVQTTTAS